MILKEKEFKTNFRNRFRESLKEKKITKYRVSKDLGIGYMQVKSWHSGKSTPTLYYLYLISQYFQKDFINYEEK